MWRDQLSVNPRQLFEFDLTELQMPWKHAFFLRMTKLQKKFLKELLKYFHLQSPSLLPQRIFFLIHSYFFEAKTRSSKFDEIQQMTVWKV